MKRLARGPAAYRREMQMSRTSLYAFVEGRVDRFFYGLACDRVCAPLGIRYRVVAMAEVCGEGGKKNLLEFFKYLRSSGSLVEEFKGKKTAAIFFADKDLDDFRRRKLRSPNLVYTEYYNVENHIFRHGDLIRATAAATSLDFPTVRTAIGDPTAWCDTVAGLWVAWVKLCFHAGVDDIRSMFTYSIGSRVNDPALQPADAGKVAAATAVLEVASKQLPATFQDAHAKRSHQIEVLYRQGRHDLVFNGKWYAKLLMATMTALPVRPVVDPTALEDKLTEAMANTLDPSQAWAERFTIPIEELAKELP